MAEIKYKFDYIAPENVECHVPGEQKLRKYDSNSPIVQATMWDEDKIDTPEDNVLAPVVTVTKNEATFTKGDMKLQKVSVTENISEIRNGVFQTLKAPSYPPIHSDVIHETPIRRMDHTSQTEAVDQSSRPIRRRDSLEAQNIQSEERRTRIPTRFKAAVNRVRRERSMPSKNVKETLPTHPRRSSIPRLKPKALSPKPEDEFERLYGEIANSPTDIDISLLNNKVDDPEKVEDCFEEIIHAYDVNRIQPVAVETNKHNNENKLQPVTVEKPKQSKIPMLKRKSEAEIDVPKSVQTNAKVSTPSGDKSRFKDAVSKIKVDSKTAETNEKKLTTRTAVTNVDSDTARLKTTYQRVKSMSRDGPKHEIQVENILKVSLEQDVGPNHAVTIDNLEASKAMESKIEIVEIIPVEDSLDLANEVTVQPYSVEIVELPTSIKDEELQNNFIEIEKKKQNEPMTDVFKADNTATEIKIPIAPVRVTSVGEYQNLVYANTKESESFKPVLEVKRNGTVVDSDHDIGKFSERLSIEKKDAITIHSQMDKKITDYGNNEKIPPLQKTTKLDSKNKEEDNAVQHRSVLSKITMFEQHHQNDRFKSIKPKPAVRCSYRRRLSEEKVMEVLEPEKNTANPNIDKDLGTDDAIDQTTLNPPTSKIPEPQTTRVVDTKPIIVSEVIKTVKSNLFSNSINNETNNPVKNKTTNYEVNNNVVDFKNLRISKMEFSEEKVAVSNAIEEIIFENQTVGSEIKEDVITYDNTGNERIKRHNPYRYYSFEVNHSRENPENVEKFSPVEIKSITPVQIEYVESLNSVVHEPKSNNFKAQDAVVINQIYEKSKFEFARRDPKESPFDFTPKTQENNSINHKISPILSSHEILNAYKAKHDDYNLRKAKSVAELDLGDAVKGKVQDLIVRMKSVDNSVEKKELISLKERPRKKSVMEKIALFEGVFTQGTALYTHSYTLRQVAQRQAQSNPSSSISNKSEEEYQNLLDELKNSKQKYGTATGMPKVTLSNGAQMPVMAVGTALLDPRLAPAIIATAIDLGYRAIDTAFIYGNEKAVGEGIKQKIADGTVKREELFVIAKLWSTSHRRDLVEKAYQQSLASLGLEYVDLYLIHNPMSFKEGPNPIPMISRVVQYSEHDYLDAWYGMEDLVTKGLVKNIGLSNFNSSQVQKILDKARFKPIINQVECHPYLSQERLYNFCDERNIKLSCFGVLGSKGTPPEHKNTTEAAIDDPMVQIMAAGLNVSPAQLLIRYQLQSGHTVVVKASTGAHMWDNLQALNIKLSEAEMNALRALNRNKRAFVFKGMGETHKNYPFNAPF